MHCRFSETHSHCISFFFHTLRETERKHSIQNIICILAWQNSKKSQETDLIYTLVERCSSNIFLKIMTRSQVLSPVACQNGRECLERLEFQASGSTRLSSLQSFSILNCWDCSWIILCRNYYWDPWLFYSLDTLSTWSTSSHCNKPKCLQELPDIPRVEGVWNKDGLGWKPWL